MDFKKITRELIEYGILSEEEKVQNEGELLRVFFDGIYTKEGTTDKDWRKLGHFIATHMENAEFAAVMLKELYMEPLYQYVKSADMVLLFLKKTVDYYRDKERLEFYDYEDIIAFLFRFSANLTILDFKQAGLLTEEDTIQKVSDYFDVVNVGLMFAGEKGDIGNAYQGGERIRKYAGYLNQSILEQILERAEGIHQVSRIELRYRLQMIELCQCGQEEKRRLHFRYNYMLDSKELLKNFFQGYFTAIAKTHHENSDMEFSKKYDEILLYEGDESGGKYLLAIEKLQGSNAAFVVMVNQRLFRFGICLNEEMCLEYVTEDAHKGIIRRVYDRIWKLEKSDFASWKKQKDINLRHMLWEIINQITEEIARLLQSAQTEKSSKLEKDTYLEILYVYIKSMYGREFNRELPFSDAYTFTVEQGNPIEIHMTKKEEELPQWDFFSVKDWAKQAADRTEGRIRNINALIGKNGSGKTSVTRLLMESEIFGDVFAKRRGFEGEYCLIYRSGKNLYYSFSGAEDSTARGSGQQAKEKEAWVTVTCDTEPVYLFQNLKEDKERYQELFNTTVVLYHNIVNPMDDGLFSGATEAVGSVNRIDLSTTNRLKQESYERRFWDIVAVMNFMEDVEEWQRNVKKAQPATSDFWKQFELKEVTRVEVHRGEETEWLNREEFVEQYDKFLRSEKKASFALTNLSSGECARLLLFSRLHSVFHINEKYLNFFRMDGRYDSYPKKTGGNFFLLLDEMEVCFHPSWQRSIIYDLISFLEWEETNFKAYDNLQLLLSSNSPFFLSDLPKTKLIHLEQGNAPEQRRQTFGENIHTILKNSFLKKDGLMGKFAQSKIEKAFMLLKQEEIGREEWNYIDEIMQLVEEPILKHALWELYQVKLEEQESTRLQIEAYQKQIQELEDKVKALQKREG